MERTVMIRPLDLYVDHAGDTRAIVFDDMGVSRGVFQWQDAIAFATQLAVTLDCPWDIETP